jgi:DeoR family fructose operon transcriptional repressor
MQKSKRIKLIKEFLTINKDVQIAEICDVIDASESTIRRDIKYLAKSQFLTEHYGSVVLNEQNDPDVMLNTRLEKHIEEKNKAGQIAASKIQDNDFVYIDAGSTTFYMLRYITSTNLTIVTNGLNIALEASRLNFNVFIIGGEMKYITAAIIGEQAVKSIENYRFDRAFIGTNGYTDKAYSTPDIREGVLKSAVISQSNVSYIITDTSKYNKMTSYVFANSNQCHLITEKSEVL